MNVSTFSPEELLGPLNDVERKNAPSVLYAAGDAGILQRGAPRASIVGTRRPSGEGLAEASEIAGSLAQRGVVVVSGLAEGIDTAAHEAAIAAGGRTIAVLGTPLDVCYPKRNELLQARLASEQLLISQFPPGQPTMRSNFPMRNRTMALISDVTVIVEAGDGSGTLHQGWEALRLGRPLFIPESAVRSGELQWPREFMKYGAIPFTPDLMELILEYLPESRGAAASTPSF